VAESKTDRAAEVNPRPTLDGECPVTFTAIAGKCPVAGPHHGSQAIPLVQVAQMEGALVTERFFSPPLSNSPHLQKSALVTRRILASQVSGPRFSRPASLMRAPSPNHRFERDAPPKSRLRAPQAKRWASYSFVLHPYLNRRIALQGVFHETFQS
jgi:hypothetical protein